MGTFPVDRMRTLSDNTNQSRVAYMFVILFKKKLSIKRTAILLLGMYLVSCTSIGIFKKKYIMYTSFWVCIYNTTHQSNGKVRM